VNIARKEAIPALVKEGYLKEFKVARRGKPAEIWLCRTDKIIPTTPDRVTPGTVANAPAAVSN